MVIPQRNSSPEPASAAPHGGGSVRLSMAKRLAFSLVAVGLILLLSELVLALLGLSPQRFENDPYLGFSSQAPLFVEDKAADGTVIRITSPNKRDFFNPQQFAARKPAGRYRIFSMGGSTAYGHPYADPTSFSGWLRQYLRAAAPEREWEVINAGGISYASYREARLMEELVRYQPDLFIVYGSHNEFLEQRLYGRVERQSWAVGALTGICRVSRLATLLKNTAASAFPSRTAGASPTQALPGEPETELEKTLGPTSYSRNEPLRDQILEHYRFNLGRMVEMARSVGARILFIAPASNLHEASPFKSQHGDGLAPEDLRRWQELYEAARNQMKSSGPSNAIVLLDQASAIDDRFAQLHFFRGRVLERLGRFQEAKAAYVRARDEDVCPLRAPSAVVDLVRQAAAQHQVPLIDFERLLESMADHGIPGDGLFLDHVHTGIEGYRLLALEILKTMEKDGLARPNWSPNVIDQVTKEVSGKLDAPVHGFALMNICKTLGWAGKREEAYRAGLQAAKMSPNTPAIQYEAGLAAFILGRNDEAVGFYRRALELNPKHALAHCNLGGILRERGDLEAAVAQYRLALQYGVPRDKSRDQKNLDDSLRQLAQKSGDK